MDEFGHWLNGGPKADNGDKSDFWSSTISTFSGLFKSTNDNKTAKDIAAANSAMISGVLKIGALILGGIALLKMFK